jgi:uncharacterized phiE125 gp8 family phage protein
MTIALDPKRPEEVIDYIHDWGPFLVGDRIASQDTSSSDVTITDNQLLAGSRAIKTVFSGGTSGKTAIITQTILTEGGRTETEIFLMAINDAEEPVSLEEAKAHLNIIDDESQDKIIASYIRSARAYVEDESGTVFVRRQFVETFDSWPPQYIRLSKHPIVSIDEVLYQGTDGTPQPFTDYIAAMDFSKVTPNSTWPTLATGGSALVRYTAGFPEGAQTFERELARQAIFVLVGNWFANRETVLTSGAIPAEIPFAARALIDRFRKQVM